MWTWRNNDLTIVIYINTSILSFLHCFSSLTESNERVFAGTGQIRLTCLHQKANLMYKCVNKLAPNYLCHMFTPRTLPFDLRNASQKLYLPKPRTDHLKRSFSYSGASLWNDLPEDIRTTKSLRSFKRRINKWLSVSDSHTANM